MLTEPKQNVAAGWTRVGSLPLKDYDVDSCYFEAVAINNHEFITTAIKGSVQKALDFPRLRFERLVHHWIPESLRISMVLSNLVGLL